LVNLVIADPHVIDPLGSPLVQSGGLDARDDRPEGPVRSRAVGADKDSKIERGPYIVERVQVGWWVPQSAQFLLVGLLRIPSKIFRC
jgi:hypothetical protein